MHQIFIRLPSPYFGKLNLKFPIVIGSIPKIKNFQKRRKRLNLHQNAHQSTGVFRQIDLGSKIITEAELNGPVTLWPFHEGANQKFFDDDLQNIMVISKDILFRPSKI